MKKHILILSFVSFLIFLMFSCGKNNDTEIIINTTYDTIIFNDTLLINDTINTTYDTIIYLDTIPYFHNVDTIEPLEYFPAYPGSYWVYEDNYSYEINDTLKVADEYKICIFNTSNSATAPDWDSLILPAIIKRDIYIMGYGDHNEIDYDCINGYSIVKNPYDPDYDPIFKSFFSEIEDEMFYIENLHHYGKTIKSDTSILVQGVMYDGVILIARFSLNCYNPEMDLMESCAHVREFFAKDIGLIRRDVKNHSSDYEWETLLELTDYSINR